jgi:hypothetical protein
MDVQRVATKDGPGEGHPGDEGDAGLDRVGPNGASLPDHPGEALVQGDDLVGLAPEVIQDGHREARMPLVAVGEPPAAPGARPHRPGGHRGY